MTDRSRREVEEGRLAGRVIADLADELNLTPARGCRHGDPDCHATRSGTWPADNQDGIPDDDDHD